MFETGLVSISFRNESPGTIISAASRAGLGGIEWGGDVHVPPDDLSNARAIGMQTREAGLKVMAYGSYYRLGCSPNPVGDFRSVLETTYALGTDIVRIWAGNTGSSNTSQELRIALQEEAFSLASMAEEFRICIALECHNDTLTDHWKSSMDFIRAVDHPNMKMYWQPNHLRDAPYNRRAAVELAPHTLNIHVFHWDAKNRYPLEKGAAEWKTYLEPFRKSGRNHGLLLEFMHDDTLGSLNETAKTLRKWIEEPLSDMEKLNGRLYCQYSQEK